MTARSRSPGLASCALLLFASLLPAPLSAQDVLVPEGASWKYLDDGSDQGNAWQALAFDDSAWAAGPAPLGYGGNEETTTVGYGPNQFSKYITTWFRHGFNVTDPSPYQFMMLRLRRDDGAVVYLNGVEVFRSNMPTGAIHYLTGASTAVISADEYGFFATALDPTLLLTGANVLAVELHQVNVTSSDLSFDLQLLADSKELLKRGPYLQLGTSTGITVRWRTHVPTLGRVWYGPSPTSLTSFVDDGVLSEDHSLTLSGLGPATTVFYAVATPTDVLVGGDSAHQFTTAPLPGTVQPLRIWALGDSGEANGNADAVAAAYASFTGTTPTDVWLMLGDNAYLTGTDSQYQAAVFDRYPGPLASHALWSTRGNHDASLATYLQVFDLPTAGQAGGVPSGTEAYYSFDYANVHFLCLDSQGSSRAVGGPMWTWAQSDLMATTQDWIIAFWHHPPYTKGSHNSDLETKLAQMRTNFLPLLEDHGVDLVLGGHSHSYERSFLLDGHYGNSLSLTSAMILDGGDGNPAGSGGYAKGVGPHEGAIYCVAGSSSKLSAAALNHPVMVHSALVLGSLVIDVLGDQLQLSFVDNTGAVEDTFTLQHYDSWTDLGNGLAGSNGLPVLDGRGPLLADTFVGLDLSSALAAANAVLVAGLTSISLPFKGGVMVPQPDVLFTGLTTDGNGALSLTGSWPPGLPAGVPSYYQYWIVDPLGPLAFAASNALVGVAQ